MTRLAFSTLACPGWTLPEVINAARRYGYDGVELRLIDGEVIDPAMPAAERERVGRLFAEAGLPIVCVGTSIRLAEAADPAAAEAALRGSIALAHAWRAPLVRVFGGGRPPEKPAEGVIAAVAAALSRIAPDAERLGVAVALETHDAFSSAAAVAAVLRRVPSPAVGALWDLHHPFRMGEGPERVMDLLGGRVLHVHVKDARRGGNGWRLVLLGEGEVPVARSLEVLRARGYRGWLTVEWEKKWHPDIADPAVALPQHIACLRAWLPRDG